MMGNAGFISSAVVFRALHSRLAPEVLNPAPQPLVTGVQPWLASNEEV